MEHKLTLMILGSIILWECLLLAHSWLPLWTR
jgi:hypothetical protein